MYLLIEGSKDSYNRPIIFSIVGEYDSLEEASNELKSIIYYDYENEKIIEEIIKKHKKYYENNLGNYMYLNYNGDFLTYYSTGCSENNEYGRKSYEIFKVGE